MFYVLLIEVPGIVFLAKEKQKIIGVLRIKSTEGTKATDTPMDSKDVNVFTAKVYIAHQGLGIGYKLMERFCKEVNACWTIPYLEKDLGKNVHFYEKFGFKVISESEIFAVKNRYMLRASRGND